MIKPLVTSYIKKINAFLEFGYFLEKKMHDQISNINSSIQLILPLKVIRK